MRLSIVALLFVGVCAGGCRRSKPSVPAPGPVAVPAAPSEVKPLRPDVPDAGPSDEPEDAGDDEPASTRLGRGFVGTRVRDGGNSATRSFFVATNPGGATIFVDHVEMGLSPLTVEAPANTVWGLVIEKAGYLPVEQRIWPQPEPQKEIVVELEELPVAVVDAGAHMGELDVDSYPMGYIVLDGQDAGLTPQVIAVPPGHHEVMVMNAMCVIWKDEVSVSADSTSKVFARLLCFPGR